MYVHNQATIKQITELNVTHWILQQ